MAINAIQAAIRSMTGTERQFSGDLHAYWDQLGIPPGQFAERMVAWKQLPQNAAWIAATEDADAAEVVDGLWRNGEQGVWYDADDLSTMFQDAAGTLPVYAPGQGQIDPPVGRILDKSGRGNHAYKTTTTSRPTLSARYNGFLASEKFDDPYWPWQASFTSQKTTEITDPSGGFDAWKITSTKANAALSRAGLAGFRNPVFTMVAKAGTWMPSIMIRNATTAVNMVNAPLTSGDFTNSYGKYSARDLGGGWKEMKIEITSGVAVTDVLIAYLGSTSAIPVGQYMYLLRADFRESGDGVGLPPYQCVIDAKTYDTVGFPLYLRFDGVDDWIQTANVDFSGVTAVLVMTAVRKLSDASRGIIVELGGSGYGQPGSFNIEQAWFSPNWSSSYSGATGSSTVTEPGIAAPASAVVGSYADQGAPSIQLRYQGRARAPSTAAVGGGGFLNAPVYIGRRGGSSSAANMRLYGLLVRGGPAADNQVAAVGKRLNQQARIY